MHVSSSIKWIERFTKYSLLYPGYKYVCMYVCLLLSIIGIFGYHLGFYFLFIIGIIWYFNNKVLKNFIININFAL